MADVSNGGARLTVASDFELRVGDDIGIAVERLGTTAVGIRLHGRVRYCEARDNRVDVGVELVFHTPQEQRIAEMLFRN
jgi:hypothetical protein